MAETSFLAPGFFVPRSLQDYQSSSNATLIDGDGLYVSQPYSKDRCKEDKPTVPYAQLITQAILAAPARRITLSDIYAFAMQGHAYFRTAGAGWKVRLW